MIIAKPLSRNNIWSSTSHSEISDSPANTQPSGSVLWLDGTIIRWEQGGTSSILETVRFVKPCGFSDQIIQMGPKLNIFRYIPVFCAAKRLLYRHTATISTVSFKNDFRFQTKTVRKAYLLAQYRHTSPQPSWGY